MAGFRSGARAHGALLVALNILYRGDLESCNYSCSYCPFAKARDSAGTLAAEDRALQRFVAWVESRRDLRIGVLFTPWGEALIRPAYQHAFVRLSHLVEKVAAQTNLSYPLSWLGAADCRTSSLWCTYHPSQTSRARFLAQLARLDHLGIAYSVGMVGLREDFEEIEAMRLALDPRVYLWINAYKRVPGYYSAEDVARLTRIDPHFPTNNRRHPSLGKPCRAGSQTITIDARGTVRRCHFIDEPLGNIYEMSLEEMLRPRLCTNTTCGCHIGYVHLEELRLDELYGDRILERIPRLSPIGS